MRGKDSNFTTIFSCTIVRRALYAIGYTCISSSTLLHYICLRSGLWNIGDQIQIPKGQYWDHLVGQFSHFFIFCIFLVETALMCLVTLMGLMHLDSGRCGGFWGIHRWSYFLHRDPPKAECQILAQLLKCFYSVRKFSLKKIFNCLVIKCSISNVSNWLLVLYKAGPLS